MNLNIDFSLAKSHKLLLTPQIKQAFEILGMNSYELFKYIEQQLEANPVLDIEEAKVQDLADACIYTENQDEWENLNNASKINGDVNYYDMDDANENSFGKVTEKSSLKEYLLFQLHTSGLNSEQIMLGEYLVSNLDENGYLKCDISEAAFLFNISPGDIKGVLEHLQTYDPPGVCARSLKECLLIQLKQKNIDDVNIRNIIEKYLNELADNRIADIAESLELDEKKVIEALNLIKTLEPRPGREFYNSVEVRYIIPDLLIKKIKERFEVIINEDAFPIANLNDYYMQIASDTTDSEARAFIQNKVDNALWLIKCIESRRELLRRVAEYIVKSETVFLNNGKKYLVRLEVEKAAEELNICEDVLRRIIEGKYIECLWGTFEIKCFFSN